MKHTLVITGLFFSAVAFAGAPVDQGKGAPVDQGQSQSQQQSQSKGYQDQGKGAPVDQGQSQSQQQSQSKGYQDQGKGAPVDQGQSQSQQQSQSKGYHEQGKGKMEQGQVAYQANTSCQNVQAYVGTQGAAMVTFSDGSSQRYVAGPEYCMSGETCNPAYLYNGSCFVGYTCDRY